MDVLYLHVLINMAAIFMMSANFATLAFWTKRYQVITSVHDVTNKFLSRDSNYTVDVVMWPKFDNSSIFMREVIIISIL